MMRRALATVMAFGALGSALPVYAKPPASQAFCETYSEVAACTRRAVDCATCHSVPPARNTYGAQIEEFLLPEVDRPLDDEAFLAGLPDALAAVADLDADGDGVSNLAELQAGSSPSDGNDVPREGNASCGDALQGPVGLNVCAYDPVYVFKKIRTDFCGLAPSLSEIREFAKAPSLDALDATLDACLDSEYWLGKNGVLWNMANAKIKPIQAIKSGPWDPGPIPLADYEDDYNAFVYAMIDGIDARRVLTADDFVERFDPTDASTTQYLTFQRSPEQDFIRRGYDGAQLVARERRAGMLTHRWFLMTNTMFTGLPRTTAAQAYRAFLGHDISKLEGLNDVAGEPKDYDAKGVERGECAVCHATLDPLTYPFSRYEGIGGGEDVDYLPYSYAPARLERFTLVDGDRIPETPEAGAIFGQEVNNLVEWARVAADSDDFAQNLVEDFWRLLFGGDPSPLELKEFEALWRGLVEKHNYSVEAMLHDLIRTEAYGVP